MGTRWSDLGVMLACVLLVPNIALQCLDPDGASLGGQVLEEPRWAVDRYYPVFPPVEKIWMIHAPTNLEGPEAWQGSWRINQSTDAMVALTLVSMQGIVNRNTPEIYIDWGDTRNTSLFWARELRRYVEVEDTRLEGMDAVGFLLQRYSSRFKGLVVYDPMIPDTINLATMYAGLENRIIVAPEQLGGGIPDFGDLRDLRILAQEQGWNNTEEGKYELYRWVYENLWPLLEHRMMGIISPGPPTSRKVSKEDDVYFPLGVACRDYHIALKLPVLWLSPRDEPQASLLSKFLDESPSPIPVLGFFSGDEVGTVDLASSHGNMIPLIANGNGPLDGGDLTVMSGLALEPVKYEPNIDPDHIFATLGDGPVVTIWHTDGDSMLVLLGVNNRWESLWNLTPYRPYSLSIGPTVVDLAPLVWNYYAGNQSTQARGLVCGLSGAGYMTPHYMSDEQLDDFLESTASYMKRTGLRSVWRWRPWIDDCYEPLETGFDARYYQALRDVGYLGTLVGTGLNGRFGTGFFHNDVPAPTVPPAYFLGGDTNRSWIVEDILSQEPGGNVLIHLATYLETRWGETSGIPIQDPDALGGRSVLFPRNDTYRGLVVMGPEGILAPGNYTTTYRLKIPEKIQHDATGFVHLLVVAGSDWRTLAERHLSPSDFIQASQYQNFSLEYSLDDYATEVSFLLSYNAAEAEPDPTFVDLYADYIHTTREEETLPLPKFSSILVSAWFEPRSIYLAHMLQEGGAAVLHVDEFLAALNPEFMIEWATPILGVDHPALAEAAGELEAGNHLKSLITVREALRVIPSRTHTLGFQVNGTDYVASVTGNTWATNLYYNESHGHIQFVTHGPPSGEIDIFMIVPNHLIPSRLVKIDGMTWPYDSTPLNATHTAIGLQVPQGAHRICALAKPAPPRPQFEVDPTTGVEPLTVTITEASTPGEYGISSWSLDYGDGCIVTCDTSNSSRMNHTVHTYGRSGTYTVTLTVEDDHGGGGTSTASVNVLDTPTQAWFCAQTAPDPLTVEFTDGSQSAKGAMYYWTFDEGTGSTVQESVAGGLAGLEGGSWVQGRAGQAIAFDGIDDHVEFFEVRDCRGGGEIFSDSITLEAWVKHDEIPRQIQRYVTVFGGLAVLRHAGGGELHFYVSLNGELYHLSIDEILVPDVWYHVVGTYDGSHMKLYVNGQLNATVLLSGDLQRTSNQILISSPDEAMGGLIDEVAIYNVSLTPETIRQHYQAGATGRRYPGVGESYDGIGWAWSFGDGQTSSQRNPTHSYQQGGSYLVTLTITEEDGDRDAWSQTIQLGEVQEGLLPFLALLAILLPLLTERQSVKETRRHSS